ncbi:MAG: hypothetical protein QOG15_3082 [Solirubrobacteraceae bacterium]|nr:hypothetical protein [Solirubrobacteraceae bacterium]
MALTVLAFGSAGTAQAKLRFEPKTHTDGRDVPGGPLDVTSVAFGQQDTRMFLRVRTASAWDPGQLSDDAGRSLCVVLFHSPITAARARICLASAQGMPVLRYATLDPATGQAGAELTVPAVLARPDAQTLEARFTPLDVDLPKGGFGWQVTSRWTDGMSCSAVTPCIDRVPNATPARDRRVLLELPRCFGAASRASPHCRNPALRHAVVPTPADSLLTGNAPCSPLDAQSFIDVCTWGVRQSRASTSVALVGDSHSVAWRGSLEVVAQHKRWYGYTMSRAGCPLTNARIILPTKEDSRGCMVWNQTVQLWFTQHPEVSTVIMSAHNARFKGSASAGYRAAWRQLPSTVHRIYVIRDFPYVGMGQKVRCIVQAIKHHQPAGTRCATSRKVALHPDPMAATAARLRSGRVRLLDMTRYMCGARKCFPVVGGALVDRPTAHLTRIFSTTVGPFMLRAMNRAG